MSSDFLLKDPCTFFKGVLLKCSSFLRYIFVVAFFILWICSTSLQLGFENLLIHLFEALCQKAQNYRSDWLTLLSFRAHSVWLEGWKNHHIYKSLPLLEATESNSKGHWGFEVEWSHILKGQNSKNPPNLVSMGNRKGRILVVFIFLQWSKAPRSNCHHQLPLFCSQKWGRGSLWSSPCPPASVHTHSSSLLCLGYQD